jgi:hypothetical protein
MRRALGATLPILLILSGLARAADPTAAPTAAPTPTVITPIALPDVAAKSDERAV